MLSDHQASADAPANPSSASQAPAQQCDAPAHTSRTSLRTCASDGGSEAAPSSSATGVEQLLQRFGLPVAPSETSSSAGGMEHPRRRSGLLPVAPSEAPSSASSVEQLLQRRGLPAAPSQAPSRAAGVPASAAAARPAARQPSAVKKVRRREHASSGAEGERRERHERVPLTASSQPLRLQADARRGRLMLVSSWPLCAAPVFAHSTACLLCGWMEAVHV